MKGKTLVAKGIVLFMAFLVLIGCGRTDNAINEQKTENSELEVDKQQEEIVENEEEIVAETGELIRYYDSLDNHMQLLYDAFILGNWKEISDYLEEFKKPEGVQIAVYRTPIERLMLVIEYMQEARSWQAYLGELSEGRKEGSGVMVSKRGTGYVATDVYIGTWSNNMPNGEGILSGSVNDMEHIFVGTFKQGKFDSTIQAYGLKTPELYVDWESITPQFFVDEEWEYAELNFDNGKPIPVAINVVDQYIAISKLSERDLQWMELENDGQYYYRIYDNRYNYILSMGAKAPADGYRGSVCAIYGTLFDLQDKEATYGVACYTTNRMN